MNEHSVQQEWMGILARAPLARLKGLWENVRERPSYRFLRQPEQGLVMVRGRMGATGSPFNVGEIVVTRCSVSLDDGTLGHAYVAGRSREKAEIAAVLDAMLQQADRREELQTQVIAPLEQAENDRRQTGRAKSAATKVDFFTMVRGEDE